MKESQRTSATFFGMVSAKIKTSRVMMTVEISEPISPIREIKSRAPADAESTCAMFVAISITTIALS